nr:RNA polymerase sigma factor [Allobranchiibius sp. GilTou38]
MTTISLLAPAGVRSRRHTREEGRATVVRGASATDAAVREVYDAHFGRLVGWATSLVGDRDLAHDFVTEAFIRLINHWGQVAEPRPWLYTTVANQVRDHWRKRGREAAAYDKFTAGRPVDIDVAAPEPDVATRLTVRDAVESLPGRLRMTVLLHYYADLSVAQVARELGKSEGAVKRDLYDGRKLLAEHLKQVR